MELGLVGLGRMGANMARRLMHDGHRIVAYDLNPDAVSALEAEGAEGASSLEELATKLSAPRAVWTMVPAGEITERTIEDVAAVLESGDAIVDGGNSYYRDDIRRAGKLRERGIDLGDCGPSGAGHFVKMVHNGIEYGVMASYAEGLNILENADVGKVEREADAETAPLDHPEYYLYDIDVAEVTEVWRRGSVIGSWLLDLTAAALRELPDLAEFSGRVSDSGEGRWTSIAAIDEGVPAPVLTAALYERFASRGLDDFAGKVLSAMRKQFGGHDEKRT